jgi:hypothetical protein
MLNAKSYIRSELGNEMVEIYVGPSKQHFSVHKKLLCAKADYFQKRFESTFKEGIEQAATFPKEDPDNFALFVQWIYGDSLKRIDISKHNPPEFDAFSGSRWIILLCGKDMSSSTHGLHDDHSSLELQ